MPNEYEQESDHSSQGSLQKVWWRCFQLLLMLLLLWLLMLLLLMLLLFWLLMLWLLLTL